MKIYLMRHGIASERESPGFEDDSQRPLTATGRDKINQIARALKKLEIKPDLILSSSYLRAEQTATILAKEFDCLKHLVISDLLIPSGAPDPVISMIVENYLADELFIVSHIPCLNFLIAMLAAGNPDLAINIRKGGVCCLLADDLRLERRAAMEWLLTPKLLLKV